MTFGAPWRWKNQIEYRTKYVTFPFEDFSDCEITNSNDDWSLERTEEEAYGGFYYEEYGYAL